MGQPSRRTTTSAALHSMVEWPDGSHSSVKGMMTQVEFAKKAPKRTQTMRNKIIWSDETKIELFGLNAKGHI
jgi:hypothetical protein